MDLKKWCDEYWVVFMVFGFGFIFLAFIVSMLMMPKEFRAGVMPQIWEIREKQSERTKELEQRINLLSKVLEREICERR